MEQSKNKDNRVSAIIITDDLQMLCHVREILTDDNRIRLCGCFDDAGKGLVAINDRNPDVIIMKADITDTSDQWLLNRLKPQEKKRCIIIGEPNPKGFQPADPDVLQQVRNPQDRETWIAILTKISSGNATTEHHHNTTPKGNNERIVLQTVDRCVFTQRSDVKFLRDRDVQTEIKYNGGQISVELRLRSCIDRFGFHEYIVLGKALIVNEKNIAGFHIIQNSLSELEFIDGTFLLLNAAETADMLEWINKQANNIPTAFE